MLSGYPLRLSFFAIPSGDPFWLAFLTTFSGNPFRLPFLAILSGYPFWPSFSVMCFQAILSDWLTWLAGWDGWLVDILKLPPSQSRAGWLAGLGWAGLGLAGIWQVGFGGWLCGGSGFAWARSYQASQLIQPPSKVLAASQQPSQTVSAKTGLQEEEEESDLINLKRSAQLAVAWRRRTVSDFHTKEMPHRRTASGFLKHTATI